MAIYKNIKVIFGNKCLDNQIKTASQISEKYFKTKKDLSQTKSDYFLFKKSLKNFLIFFYFTC